MQTEGRVGNDVDDANPRVVNNPKQVNTGDNHQHEIAIAITAKILRKAYNPI